jgi:hypothetical protein
MTPVRRLGGEGRVRVAVIDSGVNPGHPHVTGVAGGVAFDAAGRAHDDFVDRLGHGTAVAAAIQEKAPDAELYAVKVFDAGLRTEIAALLAALDWATREGIELVNLSLGTAEGKHEAALREAVDAASAAGVLIVSALGPIEGPHLLPGALPGVVPVHLDWSCPREEVRPGLLGDRTWACGASGYPRPIPGVPPERNLKGPSFAVANVTGLLAWRCQSRRPLSLADARALLEGRAALSRPVPAAE